MPRQRYISNEELKQCVPLFAAGWWRNKTPDEKAWYEKLWASARRG